MTLGFFSRLSRIVKSNINAILDAAEDPEKSINQIIVEMRNNQKEAKEQVAQAMVDEKKLGRKLQEAQKEALDWKTKAKLAVERGNDELAKQALARAKSAADMAQEYGRSAEAQKRAVENLRVALTTLDKKIEEAKRKKNVLLARKKTAEATRAIGTTVSSIKVDTDAFQEFERLTEKIEDMEVKAGIMLEMNTDALESKFQEEGVRDELDDELDQLKLEMGVAPVSRQLTDQAGKRPGKKAVAAEPAEDEDEAEATEADDEGIHIVTEGDEEPAEEESPAKGKKAAAPANPKKKPAPAAPGKKKSQVEELEDEMAEFEEAMAEEGQ